MLKLLRRLVLGLAVLPVLSEAATPNEGDLLEILSNAPERSLDDIISTAFSGAREAPTLKELPPESPADQAQRLRNTPGLEMAIQSLLRSLRGPLSDSGLSSVDTEIAINELRPALIELSRRVPRLESPNPWVSNESLLISYIQRLRDYSRLSMIDAVSFSNTHDLEGLAAEALVAYMAIYLSVGRNAGSPSRQRTVMAIGSLALSILFLAVKSDSYPAISLAGSIAGLATSLSGGYYVIHSMVGGRPWIPKFLKELDEKFAANALILGLENVGQEFKVLFKNTGFSLPSVLARARCEGFL